jgi:hypothetical protein
MTLEKDQHIWYRADTAKKCAEAYVEDPEPERHNMLAHRLSKRPTIFIDAKIKVRVVNKKRSGESEIKTIPLKWIERGMRLKGLA